MARPENMAESGGEIPRGSEQRNLPGRIAQSGKEYQPTPGGSLASLPPEHFEILRRRFPSDLLPRLEQVDPFRLQDLVAKAVAREAELRRHEVTEKPKSSEQKGVLREEIKTSEPQRESPVQGMTYAEYEKFVAHGIAANDLNAVREEVGYEAWRQQINARLRAYKAEEDAMARRREMSPRERAKRETDKTALREKRIQKLKQEYEALKEKKTENSRENRYIKLRKASIERELSYEEIDKKEASAGSGGDRKGPPEIPGGPQPPEDIEGEASPERGRQIINEIRYWETLRAEGKYREVDWKRLDELYLEHLIHMEACRLMALQVSPAGPERFKPNDQKFELINEDNLKDKEGNDYPPLALLQEAIRTGRTAEIKNFEEALNAYFKEAERVGLLRDLNSVLSSNWRELRVGIKRKQTTAQLLPQVEQEIQIALNAVSYNYEDRVLRGDSAVSRMLIGTDERTDRLFTIADLYARFARQRFIAAITNGDAEGVTQRRYFDNEFHLTEEGDEDASEETFWRLQHGWYMEIYARTEEEFTIAADTFLSRLELITAAPDKIFQDAQQFIDVLYKSDGAKKLLGNKKTEGFIPKLILGMEARIGMYGANDSNERYDAESYKKFLDYINKDAKGPERWPELTQLLDGGIAATLFMLDKDPRWELLFSLHGSRGQLADASYAQRDRRSSQGVYNQLYEQLVEEMLGVRIKNKANSSMLVENLDDRVFIDMFDGLYRSGRVPKGREHGDANIQAYHNFKDTPDVQLSPTQRRAKRLGRIQLDLSDIRAKILEGQEMRIKWGDRKGEVYNPLKDDPADLLEKEADANFYKRELSKARKVVDIALQIYGATGEKSKRGGGVFTVQKIDAEGNKYQDYVPVHEAEKFITCGETMLRIKYGDNSGIWDNPNLKNDYFARQIRTDNKAAGKDEFTNFKAQYRAKMCEMGRKRHISEFNKHGFEAKLTDVDYDAGGHEIETTRRVMKIKRPKENPEATDDAELIRDARGNIIKGQVRKDGRIINEILLNQNGQVIAEEVEADFHTATHHPFANWSGHTYWSYQEEHRHLLLSPKSFSEAQQIIDGTLRWQDADPVSVQLLILDPTLQRVKRFTGKEFREREGKLTMMAVEDSYQRRMRVSRELYEAFWPPLGTPTSDINIYYGLQDFGGFRKTVEHMRARFAEDPERFMRRGRRLLPYLHNPVSPLSEYMGQGTMGALAAIRLMNYPIYRIIGTFALDKFGANAEAGKRASDALDGYTDREGNYVEGLLLKLTNESDELQEFFEKLPKDPDKWKPADQFRYRQLIRKSLGRLEKYDRILSAMETRIRNASGAMWGEDLDVLSDGEISSQIAGMLAALPQINANIEYIDEEGKVKTRISRADLAGFIREAYEIDLETEEQYDDEFNEDELDEGSTSTDTGTGRHGAVMFNDNFFILLRDTEKRGGGQSYAGERYFYSHTTDKVVYFDPTSPKADKTTGIVVSDQTIEQWYDSKAIPL